MSQEIQAPAMAGGASSPVDRRRFVAYFSALGLSGTLFPGALRALMQERPITKEMIQQAEAIADVQFTDAQREQMLEGLQNNQKMFELIHQTPLSNGVEPALAFDAVLPSMKLPTEKLPFRHARPAGVKRPANLEEVAFWPVTRLAELVRTRQVKPSELTDMYLSRLKTHGPTLEAVIELTEERARAQAAQLDRELAAGKYRGPLHGIPWGAKDLLATRGYLTTWGAAPYKEQRIEEDAEVVKRLDAAGAVLVAKLTLGALAQGDVWYGGQTRNPWNPKQGSSGSSAGPAATTAAGLVGFAIGSETLGSIVSPCTRCGCSGLRPTFGRVPRTGAMALSYSMDKLGPICRSAEDCALVLEAIKGPDGRDPHMHDAPFNWQGGRKLAQLRIGYLKSAFDLAGERHPTKAYDDVVLDVLRAQGAMLKPFEWPTFPALGALRSTILSTEGAAAFDELTRSGRDQLMTAQGKGDWPNVFRVHRLVPAVEYINANRIRSQLMAAANDAMRDFDVVVSPSFGGATLLLTNLTG
ncbi:MAG TPA: amidase, partial [Longimicrobiales bacterium]